MLLYVFFKLNCSVLNFFQDECFEIVTSTSDFLITISPSFISYWFHLTAFVCACFSACLSQSVLGYLHLLSSINFIFIFYVKYTIKMFQMYLYFRFFQILDNACNIPVKPDIGVVLVLRDQSFWLIDFLGDTL